MLKDVSSDEIETYELWQRLQDADGAIQYLVDFIIKHHSDFPLMNICNNAKDEIDSLYNAIIKTAKKHKKSILRLEPDQIEKIVYQEYDDNIQSLALLNVTI